MCLDEGEGRLLNEIVLNIQHRFTPLNMFYGVNDWRFTIWLRAMYSIGERITHPF